MELSSRAPLLSATVEFACLRDTVRACLDLTTDVPDPIAPTGPLNWHQVLWLGRQQGALLFLHTALPADCPAGVRADLQGLKAAAKLQSLVRTAEVCWLHDHLERAGVPFVVIDPWMFQASFHPQRVILETTSKIRGLVRPEDLSKAEDILAATGHHEVAASFQVAGPDQTPVSLLTDLSFINDPAPLFSPARQPATDLQVGGRSLRRLSTPDWLRLLARRAAAGREMTLLSAWQIVQLARRTMPASNSFPLEVNAAVLAAHRALGLPPPATWQNETLAPPTDLTTPQSARPPRLLPTAPFLPTPEIVGERMLALANTRPDDVVFDLGCGEGRILIAAARHYGARSTGIDCNPALLAVARRQAEAAGVSGRVTLICANLFSADVRTATIICLYLLPSFYPRLREHLLSTVPAGTRIVSHDYLFPDWPPEKTELIRVSPNRVAQIYLWRLP